MDFCFILPCDQTPDALVVTICNILKKNGPSFDNIRVATVPRESMVKVNQQIGLWENAAWDNDQYLQMLTAEACDTALFIIGTTSTSADDALFDMLDDPEAETIAICGVKADAGIVRVDTDLKAIRYLLEIYKECK